MIFLRSTVLLALLMGLIACGDDAPAASSDDSTDQSGEQTDEGDDSTTPAKDAGRKDASTSAVKDAGSSSATKDAGSTSTTKDAGSTSTTKDAGSTATKDAGSTATKDAGTGLPDLGGIFGDAGFPSFPTTPTSDAGTTMGPPGDKSGPCKDLQLLCFDPFDMFIFNPSDCLTCNGGMGCQGCAIPFAY